MTRAEKIHAHKLKRLAKRRSLSELHRAGWEEAFKVTKAGKVKRKRATPNRFTTRPRI